MTFRWESVVEAPLADVWDHQIRTAGLVATTPDFVNLRIAAVRKTSGTPVDDPLTTPLAPGWEVDVETRPFGLWRDSWTSTIIDVDDDGDVRSFRDEMVEGPFPRWDHTHTFEAVAPRRTRITDTVRYSLPGPPGLDGFDHVAKLVLVPLFRYRHGRIARTVAGDG